MDRDELNERVYQCLQEIGVMLDDGDRGVMRDAGLTPAHFNILRHLESGPDATGLTITALARRTLCTRGNITRLVQRLDKTGLIELRPDPADQRLVRVFLSEAGVERLAEAERGHTELNGARFGELSHEEAANLLDGLTAVTQHLRKHLAHR